MFLRLLLPLLAVCTALRTSHYVAVVGEIPITVQNHLLTLPGVVSIKSNSVMSMIEANGISIRVQTSLKMAELEYMIELNEEIILIPPEETSDESGSIAKRQVPIPYNLDILDQLSAVGDNQYNPPGHGDDVPIYVADTGVNIQHSEFGGRASRLLSWKNEAPCVSSPHGSWVASIAAGHMYGVANKARIIDLKLPNGAVCDFYTSDAVAALAKLVTDGQFPLVLVMSWTASRSSSINYLCQQLKAKGAVLIAAAGNDNNAIDPCENSPASSGVCLVVGSVGSSRKRSSFSNYGQCIDIFGYGESIVGAGITSTTTLVQGSGTSASGPGVAGMAAIILKLHNLNNTDQVYNMVKAEALSGVVKDVRGSPNLLVSCAVHDTPNHRNPASRLSIF